MAEEQNTKEEKEDRQVLAPVAGQLLRNHESGHTFRVLYISDTPDQPCWWIDMDSKSNIPKAVSADDLLEGIDAHSLEPVIDTSRMDDRKAPSPAMIHRRDSAWRLIQGIVDKEPEIYEPNQRMILLQQTEKKTGVAINNLYRHLGRYWKGGKTKDALLPRYERCGRCRTPESTQHTRQGRPKTPGNNGKILTEKDYGIFEKAISRHYEGVRTSSLESTYRQMLGTYYVTKDANGNPISLPPDELPSINQFIYWYKKNRNPADSVRKKEGEHRFALNHRSITGKTETCVYGPSEKVQIDATIGDFYLVRRDHRNEVIGRPVIFFVRDACTRMITGMNVTLEDASWNQALIAIKNSAEDKVAYCARYGVKITEDQWPCHYLPSAIIADNGELGGKKVESIIADLGIMVENCPPYRGDLKGVIENSFHICQHRLRDIIPGYVEKDSGTRGADDYRANACMDFESFVQGLIRCVLFYNNSKPMDSDSYQVTPEMIRDRILPIPLQLWNYGMKYRSGSLRSINRDEMYRVLLPQDTASVTERGIVFQDLYYTCSEAEEKGWFINARAKGRYKIPISYDPSCVDHIYLHTEDGRLITCSLLDRSAPFKSMTEEDMKMYQEEYKQQLADHNTKLNQANAELVESLDQLVKDNTKDRAGKSKIRAALKKKNIDASREAEKEELSGAAKAKKKQKEQTEQTDPSPTVQGYRPSLPSDKVIDDALDRLMHKAGLT